MFDTMVITKAVAGICSALLIFLVGKWVADELYLPHGPAPVAYVIDTGADDAADEAADEAPAEDIDILALFAEADAEAGASQWRNCRACHALEAGRNGTGPSLHGIVDGTVGDAVGFNYSGALNQIGDIWTVEALYAFIANPRAATPGTSMNFRGISNSQDRLNLIAYIQSQSN
jgi:cytochrome c